MNDYGRGYMAAISAIVLFVCIYSLVNADYSSIDFDGSDARGIATGALEVARFVGPVVLIPLIVAVVFGAVMRVAAFILNGRAAKKDQDTK